MGKAISSHNLRLCYYLSLMSLYRKYRPTVFADVYGQEHVVTTLERSEKTDNLVHAYLFAGSRGTGKTSVARILAKTLMLRGVTDEKIRAQIAKGVDEGSIVDLLEIDAASNRGIDDIRDIIEKIQFSPVAASAKVYIIDEVHMLTKEAFNALLKTLEEPPSYAYFILATTELNKIPATIQSRCQCFPFRRVREEDIIRRLQYIADQEHIVIDREALRLIAHVAEGGMRDAISLLDQMRSLPSITVRDIEQRMGTTGREHVESALVAITEHNGPAIIEIIRTIEESGIPLDIFARQILSAVRERLHASAKNGTSLDEHVALLDALLNAIRTMRNTPVPGLVLEAALLRFGSIPSTSVPLQQTATVKKPETAAKKPEIQQPATAVKHEATVKPLSTETSKEPVTATHSAAVEAPAVTLQSVRDAWPDLMKDASPASVKMSLKNGRVADVKEDTVIVQFSSAFHRDRVKETNASRVIEDILQRIFKKNLKLQCLLENGEGPTDASSEEVVNLADAAAELF